MQKKYRPSIDIKQGWHSIESWSKVYHNNSECTEGNNIQANNERAGTANRKLCDHCKRLNRRKK